MDCIYRALFRSFKAFLQHKYNSAFNHSHTNDKAASLRRANLLSKNSNANIDTPIAQASGAVWGSVSCPRKLEEEMGIEPLTF